RKSRKRPTPAGCAPLPRGPGAGPAALRGRRPGGQAAAGTGEAAAHAPGTEEPDGAGIAEPGGPGSAAQDGPDIAEPAEPGTADPDGPGTAEPDGPDIAEPAEPGSGAPAWPRTADARVSVRRTAAHGPMAAPARAHSHGLQAAGAGQQVADRAAANLSPAVRVPRVPRSHVVRRSHVARCSHVLLRRCAPHRALQRAPRHARPHAP